MPAVFRFTLMSVVGIMIYNGHNGKMLININSSSIALIYFLFSCTLNGTLSSFTQFVIIDRLSLPLAMGLILKGTWDKCPQIGQICPCTIKLNCE